MFLYRAFWYNIAGKGGDGMQKRQIDLQNYELLKRKLCMNKAGFLNLDEDDLKTLWEGEDAFLWESSLAASAEEAAEMARQAAADMTPAPGRMTLNTVLYVMIDSEEALDAVEAIAGAVQPVLSQAGTMILGAGPNSEKGIRFLLAASEGKKEEKP